MASIKTAISLPKPLFEQVNAFASELHVSRSHIFVLAVEEYIRRHENRKLLDAINAAYDDLHDEEERTVRQKMRQRHRQLVEGEW